MEFGILEISLCVLAIFILIVIFIRLFQTNDKQLIQDGAYVIYDANNKYLHISEGLRFSTFSTGLNGWMVKNSMIYFPYNNGVKTPRYLIVENGKLTLGSTGQVWTYENGYLRNGEYYLREDNSNVSLGAPYKWTLQQINY